MDIRISGSCAMKHREPCQAGNRAALSGSVSCAAGKACFSVCPTARYRVIASVFLLLEVLFRAGAC